MLCKIVFTSKNLLIKNWRC